jgi:Domain of unknown function (DUF4177)
MKKFEYKTLPIKRKAGFWEGLNVEIQELENLLAQMGNNGWELTTSLENATHDINQNIVLIFKREITTS